MIRNCVALAAGLFSLSLMAPLCGIDLNKLCMIPATPAERHECVATPPYPSKARPPMTTTLLFAAQ